MIDINQISTVLTSLSSAIDIAKMISSSNTSLEKAEAKLQIANLISALADAKMGVSDLQQTLIDKDAELRKLQEQLQLKAKLEFDAPYYWKIEGDKKDGPYCQQCSDKDQQLIRLQGYGNGIWKCRTCKNSYHDKTHKTPSLEPVARTSIWRGY